jgi:hypothetical protein
MLKHRGERRGAGPFAWWSALIVGGAVVLVSRPARADNEAFTMDRPSLLATVEWGTKDLDVGLGARLGYTLSPGIYLGGMFEYWFGENQTDIPLEGPASDREHGWDALAIVGYDIGPTSNVLFRPFAGGGVLRGSSEFCSSGGTGTETCASTSRSGAIGTVGGLLAVHLAPVMLGGEARLLFASGAAVVLGADVGVSF